MAEIPENLCVLPWIHLATLTDGSIIPCCVARNDGGLNLHEMSLQTAWNSPYLRDLRLKMLNGEKPATCANCHIDESNGLRSHRINENKVWSDKMGLHFIKDRLQNTNADGTVTEPLMAIDLRIGNTCNLQCVMCRPNESSKWMALARLLHASATDPVLKEEWRYKSEIDEKRFEWYEKPEFIQSLEPLLPNLREIILGGGEPMLLKEHHALIESCVQSGAAKNIRLRYHTNGTVLPESLFPLWKNFAQVEIFVSLEGVGEQNHYMRYPASWTAIENNLRTLDSVPLVNLSVLLLCSIHAMSIYYLADFARWIEDQQFKRINKGFSGYFHPGLVHSPAYLSAQVLPAEAKRKVTARIREFNARSRKPNDKLEGILSFMNSADATDRLPQTREYIAQLDRHRGTNFAAVFPELSQDLLTTD